MRLKSRWGCQNHPEASTATSFVGVFGVVGISGQMSLDDANLGVAVVAPDFESGMDENAEQVDANAR